MREVADTISNLNSTEMKLEFRDVPINLLPPGLWKTSGHRVHELNFRFFDYCWNDETVKHLILNCVNLSSIQITYDNYVKSFLLKPLSQALDVLIEERITRPQLHTFSLYLEKVYHKVDLNMLNKIFLIFPNIKHLSVVQVEDESTFETAVKGANVLAWTQLESFTCGASENPNLLWSDKPIIPIIPIGQMRFESIIHLFFCL